MCDIGRWNFIIFWGRHSQVHSSAVIWVSVECRGPQQHSGVLHIVVPEMKLFLPIPSSEAVQAMTTTVFLESSEVNDYISGMLQHINMGLVSLCCRGPVHSIDTRIAALECTCQCLRQNIIPPSDIRHWSNSVNSLAIESATVTKRGPAAEGSCDFPSMQ